MISKKQKLLSIKRFAELSLTTPDTLYHYDEIGLLSPRKREENNYRYYSPMQLSHINLIRTLQTGGMPLAEIKEFAEKRDLGYVAKVLARQIRLLDAALENTARSRKLLSTLQAVIQSVSNINEREISVQFLPETPIILGPPNDYSGDRNPFDALSDFYSACKEKYPGLDLNYPVWGMYSEKQMRNGLYGFPERFYFFNPGGKDTRRAGLHAVGYTRGAYGDCGGLFTKMLSYIDANTFTVCGDAYEEYPLNEFSVRNDTEYLIRVLIPVQKK